MNVFILNTGRCGSSTFIKACKHITNYSSAHESRISMPGTQRLAYPQNHIEADNRLTWFLGRLDTAYGNNAIYVHLQRDKQQTVDSFIRRKDYGIIKAYQQGIFLDEKRILAIEDVVADYLDTANANIRAFLKNKSHTMAFMLGHAHADFHQFWKLIQATGDLQAALAEWEINYNAS